MTIPLPLGKEAVSACCGAEIQTNIGSDFGFENEAVTCYYFCTKCKEPCDPAPVSLTRDEDGI